MLVQRHAHTVRDFLVFTHNAIRCRAQHTVYCTTVSRSGKEVVKMDRYTSIHWQVARLPLSAMIQGVCTCNEKALMVAVAAMCNNKAEHFTHSLG